jgi:ABC-2 type transport system ATP-binding protein
MGIDLKSDARRARSHIGYMAQKFSLYSNLTVKQNLNFFASIYGLKGDKRKNHLDGSIEKYDLERWMHHRSGSLPLGVKQRLSMACATLHHPEFLFLDEPTSGVDPFARREFWEEINDMALRGVTIIVTTHFMDEAQYLHRMVIMDRGRVIAEGSPEELKRQASTSSLPNPDMEEAFIHFISRQEER